jgi:hypothetical protein
MNHEGHMLLDEEADCIKSILELRGSKGTPYLAGQLQPRNRNRCLVTIGRLFPFVSP